MPISTKGREFIASFEGLRLDAYLDGGGIPTIGYGHTFDVKMGDTCTQDQADQWLAEDLHAAEKCVTEMVKVTITQSQYDALGSLAYNIGCGNFYKSSVLSRLNSGDYDGAATAFLMWTKIAGQISMGLVRRRDAERIMFQEAS